MLHGKKKKQQQQEKMLVLTETSVGFVVFKLSSDAKIDNKDLWKEFETPEGANKAYVASHLVQSPANFDAV